MRRFVIWKRCVSILCVFSLMYTASVGQHEDHADRVSSLSGNHLVLADDEQDEQWKNAQLEEVINALKRYVNSQLKSDRGILRVEDLNGHREPIGSELELIRIKRDDAVVYQKDMYFVPAQFRGIDSDNNEVGYELDFFMKYDRQDEKGSLKRILLHRRDGVDQFTYLRNRPVNFWSLRDGEAKHTTTHPSHYWNVHQRYEERRTGKVHEEESTEKEDRVEQFLEEVKTYLRASLRENTLPVEHLDGERMQLEPELKLLEIRASEAVLYQAHTGFVPVIVEASHHSGDSVQYEFDVFMKYEEKTASWTIDRILLHKADGKKRFIYLENLPVPGWSLDEHEEKTSTEHPVNYWKLDQNQKTTDQRGGYDY